MYPNRTPDLKLVGDAALPRRRPHDPADPLPTAGWATVTRQQLVAGQWRTRLSNIRLIDICEADLGGIAAQPLPPGEPVTIHLCKQNLHLLGHVTRCRPRPDGHELAIRINPGPGAA